MKNTPNPFDQIATRLESIEYTLNQLHKKFFESKKTQVDSCWMSIDDLCKYLPHRPSRSAVYKLVHTRVIPHKKVGRHLFFLKSEIDRWLQLGDRMTETEKTHQVNNHIANAVKNR